MWNFSLSVEIFFQHEKRNFIPPSGHVMFYFLNTNEIPNHFTWIVFWSERCSLLWSHSNGDIFTCEDNMLFSHVKISSFCAKAHLVFHWCLYNKIILIMLGQDWCYSLFSWETKVNFGILESKVQNICRVQLWDSNTSIKIKIKINNGL